MKIFNIYKNITRKLALDSIHPIGEVFCTTDANFNPNITWGGTWVLLKDKFLVGAGGSYGLGAIGGEATHTLTEAEMPKHKHTINFNDSEPVDIAGGGRTTGYALSYVHATTLTDSKYLGTTKVGSSNAHNNLPPYQAVNMWHRTA